MKKVKRFERNHEGSLFQLLMFHFFPYWPFFLGASVLAFSLAWIYLRMATPVYNITSTLLIKDEKRGVENSQVVESLDILNSKKIVENEIEVIKSRKLVLEIVKILNLCAPISEDLFFGSSSAYTSSPLSVEVKDVDRLIEADKVSLEYFQNDSVATFDGNEYPLNTWVSSPYGEIRFVQNVHLVEPGMGPFYVSFIHPRKVVTALIGSLGVESSNKLTTVLNLSLPDVVPIRGENILNTLMESYYRASVNDKNSLAANTLEFVEERIRLVEQELDSLERSIQRYKSTRGIVDLSEQGKVFLKNVGDNDQKLSDIDMQTAVLDQVEQYVTTSDGSKKIVPSTLGISDVRLSQLIQKLYDSEVEYERLKKTTAENNPILVAIQNEIANLRPSILENIRNQKLSLVASRANLTSTNDKYSSLLQTIPRQEMELLEANRQQVIKNDVYTFLLQKREETILSSSSTVGDSRVVDNAQASIAPVSPKPIIVYGGGISLGLLIVMMWIVKKEMLNGKVLFRSEIEALTNIPVAAEISDSQSKDYVVIDNFKKPFLTEQFIQLRATLGLYNGRACKTMMVTSSIEGEGKSFISTNFGISLAGTDKKVLLVDFDLRNPRLSNLYNVGNVSGIAEFLSGQTPIEKVIRRTVTPNLYLIGAGKNRSKATAILLDGNIRQLFERLRRLFDYIIVDTPPVTPVVDAFLIAPYSDATLFVVRHGKTPKAILDLLDQNSKIKGLGNVSIVFNGVKSRGLINNRYGYGYGRQYMYPNA